MLHVGLFTGFVIIIALIVYLVNKGGPLPIAGVYRQPGTLYWLKRFIIKIVVRLRSRHRKKKDGETKQASSGRFMGYGRGDSAEDMERPQMLSSCQDAIDCIYFNGTDKEGNAIVCRIGRRHNREAEVWLILDVTGVGFLQHPCHPDTYVAYTDGSSFSAGGLRFEMLEPMSRWKVTYSGKLRRGLCNDLQNKPEEFVETSFSFIWSALSQPVSMDTEMSDLLGDALAREIWTRELFHSLKRHHQSHYDQWGELRGTATFEGQEERQLCFQTVRDHSYGTRDWRNFHRYILHYIYLETGTALHVGIFSQPGLLSHLKLGHIAYANGDKTCLSDVQLKLWEIGEKSESVPESWKFGFTADGQRYEVEATRGEKTSLLYHEKDRGGKVLEMVCSFRVNQHVGRGVTEFFYRNYEGPSLAPHPPLPLVCEPSTEIVQTHVTTLTLPFSHDACSSSALVGGKGAQLAQLTSLQSHVDATVPPGFCLTLRSFEQHLEKYKTIVDAIDEIRKTAVSDPAKLPDACTAVVTLLSTTPMCPEVEQALTQALWELKGSSVKETHFAVRSSAAGEDGCEASSAGQMDTILGVVGVGKILEAVRQCWSSVYTLQAVEYRKQHGQPVSVSVGVVIQEMVPASVAGVIFTCNPVSGSHSSVVINANFGLGESVVSGKVNPDTIHVDRHPEFVYGTDRLRISSSHKGEKKIKITEHVDGGLSEEAITEEDQQSLCLSEKMILQLAALGLKLEQRFGSPRDVEWAIADNKVFLLQCRPVTVVEAETETELMHEFDSPASCDYLWFTTSNISEMMPGAVTPLTLSTFVRAIERGLQKLNMYVGGRTVVTQLPKSLPNCCNHLFINMTEVMSVATSAMLASKEVAAISLVGSVMDDLTTDQIENYQGKKHNGWRRFWNFFSMLRMWTKAKHIASEWAERIPSYTVGPSAHTSLELYSCINDQLTDYETVWVWTLINSGRSGQWASILMSVIGGDAGGWNNELYSDIALLLSHCVDVYSAEVPHAIESIAREVAKYSEFRAKFVDTPDSECMTLLQQKPQVAKMVESFLKRHGHRCLRESELREKSWSSAPEKFISVVKMVLGTIDHAKVKKEHLTVDQLLDNMTTQVTLVKKQVLKRLLPKAWAAVGTREWGKSVSIQMSEIFKLAYGRLATLMHEEGRLPDPDLLYFLTHREIGTVLSTRSARLIIKAQRRRKVLSLQTQQKFPRLIFSHPVPVNSDTDITDSERVVSLKGMPVSQGVYRGVARVVLCLEEASVIKAGDILVVTSTDVGWSPYFPLIGGLVTELGGLISHGAVVAREYGIPCVVNVANATAIIQSGEELELNGRHGTVKRLEVTEDVSKS